MKYDIFLTNIVKIGVKCVLYFLTLQAKFAKIL